MVLAVAWLSFVVTRWFIAIFTNPRAARAIAEEAHYDTKGAAASRMLVIRGVDDEASLSLAAGSIGSRLSYLVLVGVIPLIVAISFMLVWMMSFHIPPAVMGKSALASVISATVVLGAGVFFILPGVFKSVFGREFLVSALVCDIAVNSVPDAFNRVEAITLPPVEEGAPPGTVWQMLQYLLLRQLRHGIYGHPGCVACDCPMASPCPMKPRA